MNNYKEMPEAALESLFSIPEYYLLRFSGNDAHFVRMSRKSYLESIFTDSQRIVAVDREIYRIDIVKLLEIFEAGDFHLPAIQIIFHVANCGSTLLARALDRPASNLVCREPSALRQLAVAYNPAMEPVGPASLWYRCLRMVCALLGRSYEASQVVIIKANVPVNFILSKVLEVNPESSAILLYSDLESFLIAALKSPERKFWVSHVVKELVNAISSVNRLTPAYLEGLSLAEAAACLWLAQMNCFNSALVSRTNIRSLHCDTFYENSTKTLACAFDFFNQEVTRNEIYKIINGDLFSSYSKSPGLRYSNQVRMEEKLKHSRILADDILVGTGWVATRLGGNSVPTVLPASLLDASN